MNSITFTRNHTQILKGIALVLMLVHHTCTPSYWETEGSHMYMLLQHLQYATKMCVWIFAFLVGYGFFCSKNKTIHYSFKRILLLVVPFWIMLFGMFIPAAYTSGELGNALNSNGGGKTICIQLIYNMFGLVETLNWYSWFVGFYCICILIMPFLHKVLDKYKYGWLVSTIGFYIIAIGLHTIPNWDSIPMIAILFTSFRLIPLIIIGYMCAMWNVQGKLPHWFEGKKRMPIALLAIVQVMALQTLQIPTAGFCVQAFYTPFLVFALVGIFNSFKLKRLKQGFTKVGDLSMYMWFFHAIFFTETVNLYTKNLVFEPFHNFFYTFTMTFVLTYLGSWIIKNIVSPIINRIK